MRRHFGAVLLGALLGGSPLHAQLVGFNEWPSSATTPFSMEVWGYVRSNYFNFTRLTFTSPADPGAYGVVPDYTGFFPAPKWLLADLAGPSDPLELTFGPGTPNEGYGIYSFPIAGIAGIGVTFVMLGDGVATGTAYFHGGLVASVSTRGSSRAPGVAYSLGGINLGAGGQPLLFDRLVLTSTAPQFAIAPITVVRVSALPEPAPLTLVATGGLAIAGAALVRRRRRRSVAPMT